MYRRLSVSVFGYWAILVILTVSVTSAYAVTNVKESKLNGGQQYWWEAEDFDDRDEEFMVLKDEPDSSVPDLPGASGDQYIVHISVNTTPPPEDSHFLEYKIEVSKAGTYYVWVRASFDRTPGGRTHNSQFVQVNGKPAGFVRHVNTIGDANWPDDIPADNPWTWVGDSSQPPNLVGAPGGGLTNGLAMDFDAGENILRIYHREGAPAPNTWCTDVIMISTVDFLVTDEDYGKAALAVEPVGKLATKWAQLKTDR